MSDETLRAAALAAVERLQSDGSVWIKPDVGLLRMRSGRALDFIAAAHPAVVLDLLDRLERAEAARERWRENAIMAMQALAGTQSGHRGRMRTELGSGSTDDANGAQNGGYAKCWAHSEPGCRCEEAS